jgi:hypothetical protein
MGLNTGIKAAKEFLKGKKGKPAADWGDNSGDHHL